MEKSDVRSAIEALSPRTFENFIYDLAVAVGLKNVTWRTPGADGGRDIEATFVSADPFGAFRQEKWFIECKKFNTCIAWPIIHSKVAFAQSNDADVLCVACFPNPSPTAETEITKWNRPGRSPRITVLRWYEWEFGRPELRLIAYKYGIQPISSGDLAPIAPALKQVSGLAKAAYDAGCMGIDAAKQLEAAACLSDLVEQANAVLSGGGMHALPTYCAAHDSFEWFAGPPELGLPSSLVRAIVSALRLSGSEVQIGTSPDGTEFRVVDSRYSLEVWKKPFESILTILDFEYEFSKRKIIVRDRK